MSKPIYFFDTYAIIEILKGNKGYEKFKDSQAIISTFNLAELHLHITRIFGAEVAENSLGEFSNCVAGFEMEDFIEATKFKLKDTKKNFSIPDSIGYAMSKRLGLKFLTGDKNFQDLGNVEFVK